MKWYRSLATKNVLLFASMSILFILVIVLNLNYIKKNRLKEKVEEVVVQQTHLVVRALLVEQRLDEMLVRNMAELSSVEGFEKPLEALLDANIAVDIVSAGVWYEPLKMPKETYFYKKNSDNKLVKINNYEQESSIPYRQMEFYVLGRYLQKGETFWTKIYTDSVTKERMVSVVSPIYKKEKFIGVASVDIRFTLGSQGVFSSLLSSEEQYFMITDRMGEMIIHSDDLWSYSNATNIQDLGISLFTELFHIHKNRHLDKDLAQKISIESPEISFSEAMSLSYEMKHKINRYATSLTQEIKMVDVDPIFDDSSVVTSVYFPHTGWNMFVGIPEDIVFKDTLKIYNKIMIITVLFALLTATLGFFFVRRSIVLPLESITQQIEKSQDNFDAVLYTRDRGEIDKLVRNFNLRTKALLKAHDNEAQNEKLLLQQSKMAAMGEMLDAVAHQWKQPLNALSMYSELIVSDYEEGLINKKYIQDFQDDVQTQIGHMTETLGTFRSFFRPSQKQSLFNVLSAIDDVLFLAKDELMKHTINVEVISSALEIYGSENEFKHLLLNIVNNAKDAFIDNNIKKRDIKISIINDEKPRLEIQDSAGGIPTGVIEDIFKAHFTTKEEGKGTGIGLYMSSQIAEKHHAKLSVQNRDNGACFSIIFTPNSFKA